MEISQDEQLAPRKRLHELRLGLQDNERSAKRQEDEDVLFTKPDKSDRIIVVDKKDRNTLYFEGTGTKVDPLNLPGSELSGRGTADDPFSFHQWSTGGVISKEDHGNVWTISDDEDGDEVMEEPRSLAEKPSEAGDIDVDGPESNDGKKAAAPAESHHGLFPRENTPPQHRASTSNATDNPVKIGDSDLDDSEDDFCDGANGGPYIGITSIDRTCKTTSTTMETICSENNARKDSDPDRMRPVAPQNDVEQSSPIPDVGSLVSVAQEVEDDEDEGDDCDCDIVLERPTRADFVQQSWIINIKLEDKATETLPGRTEEMPAPKVREAGMVDEARVPLLSAALPDWAEDINWNRPPPVATRKRLFFEIYRHRMRSAMQRVVGKYHNGIEGDRGPDGCWLYRGSRLPKGRNRGLHMDIKFQHNARSERLNLNILFVKMLLDGTLTRDQIEGIIEDCWHASHLCGNWTCLNVKHVVPEPGAINISRNPCMKNVNGPCYHRPRCMKNLKLDGELLRPEDGTIPLGRVRDRPDGWS
ncbi:hypothetical protein BU23DRAFT_575520 [Bimuria novae-zelandiae CBS 107.79]|uniref:Zinc-binding loop region of homing endonuclease domain-containing protein n=1 Tax=Bimuria novae-zelandiae CBS 107.79 TaxID=1447943 RepID=A0A6A5UJ56_9PLEO|nr:hypothetical protein BU23DRAFT_575520 [Bimuria novae-zelandiae CBS 107.79]